MKRLFGYADAFMKESGWKDWALVKFCLLAVGVMLGLAAPKKAKKKVLFVAMAVFIATYIPLILKFIRILLKDKRTSYSSAPI